MKELEDHDWFPAFLRAYQTEFIGFFVARFNIYAGFVKYLRSLSLRVLPLHDLCSGSGEPAISIFKKSSCFNRLTLSDKYPNPVPVPDERISYESGKKDVLDMKFDTGAYYTMFNAFHHFNDQEKLEIVRKLQASACAAFLVEILEPSIFCFLKVLFVSTAGTTLLTPFVKPFSLKRLFFTYILPVNILTITFDGVVSVFRSHSVKQYQALFAGYTKGVEVLKIKSLLAPVIVIHIQPDK